ncbi:hypothetical protein Pth03_24390 [Planotetraspora thailandica]|uniref:Uncharacterized protein n=1 Tax=Planotetraspora thailandica TaxID=487172 RepID=A0A8J3XVJ5_9ACTN|nr:hypothetical protein [Planotetraspora thailandica]GII54050.1 hypothetical protein Pth03_24390 [Planotetraspora thailandica]
MRSAWGTQILWDLPGLCPVQMAWGRRASLEFGAGLAVVGLAVTVGALLLTS